ncbi:MAG TPA: penicillin-binding transpeptidase domain-containing protein, partial [Solirubrobacteraceae bacterium]|nr:penicillin-binding transpeptidase domain-containing protein [Solirubrobacteraceae bacterium]
IEAMAESESYEQSQYNLAADGHRQPGSTMKAIDLADALSRGIDPNTTYYNSHTLEPGWLPGYPSYLVKTFGGEQNGTINLVSATLKSDNTVYAQLAADLGEETITQMAYAMGVQTHLSSFPAEALGGLTLGVTPLEMAVVYATLADGGWRNTPIAITKVVFPDGHVDESWGQPNRVRVLSEAITGEETRILHLNVLGGTAGRSQINCPTAAKTGTTSELYDAWLDGYNSEYSTVVWMGYPKRDIAMTDVHGEPQQGGYLPAEIWHAYMAPVTEGHPCAPLHESSQGISYRPFYGKYATTGLGQHGESQSGEEPFSTGAPAPHGGNGERRKPPANTPSEPQRAPSEPQQAPSEPQHTPSGPHSPPSETPAPAQAPTPSAPAVNTTGGAGP